MKHTLWKWKFLTFLLLILFSCQKDELLKNENEPHQHIGESSTKIVSAEDIPKVMEFLNRKTHGHDGFEIRLSMMQGMQTFSDEPDLVFAELVTDNVMAYTNEAGITNYSFQMSFENEPEFENEVSFFNLIVKEINTEEGFYSYIQEYRADKEWYLNSGWLFDMHTYTGKMIFYTLEGLYVARVTFLGGEIIENHFGSPCPNPDDPTSGDPGSGGNSGPGPGGDPSGGTGGTDGGTGGFNISAGWLCNWRNELHANPGICDNAAAGGSWVIIIDGMPIQIMQGCGPAPDECFDQYNDPCPIGCNSEGGCIEENDGTIINIPTFFIEASNAINNGGEVDYEYQVILNPEFVNNECLYGVYEDMGKAPTFNDYLENFDGDMSVANLRFGFDENFSENYEPSNWDALAVTNPPQDYLIKIDFNGDPALPNSNIYGQPKLIIALAFIHEMIHAEIFRKMMSVANLPHVNFQNLSQAQWENLMIDLMNNFPGIWDYYLRYEVNAANPTGSQHQQMAAHYIDTIASVLAEYDNNQKPQSVYEAIAWIGLKDTTAWNNLTTQEQTSIDATISNFYQNETNICD